MANEQFLVTSHCFWLNPKLTSIIAFLSTFYNEHANRLAWTLDNRRHTYVWTTITIKDNNKVKSGFFFLHLIIDAMN